MTTSIMGVGATRRVSAVHWGVARQVLLAWIFTIPGAAAVAWVVYLIAHVLVPG
jgi:PiT family inorganic phosphate transporter